MHGRWNYIRNAEMILYFYYKNFVFAIPQFLYCFYNAYSGQTLFDDYYITFYNLGFTSIPVVVKAILDQDLYYKKWRQSRVRRNSALEQHYPNLYYVGQQNMIFSYRNIFAWMLEATVTAIILFYVSKFIMSEMVINKFSNDIDL